MTKPRPILASAPSEESDQPGHPHSLIIHVVFAVRSMGS